MFMSCIGILLFCFVKIFAEPPSNQDKVTTTFRPTERPENNPLSLQSGEDKEPCRGDGCRSPPNLVAPIVGSLCGILIVALIGVFIVWFYLKRKNKKTKKIPMTPVIKYIEQPPLYTGAISTTDSSSRLYGMSSSRNDSINSHHYDKIDYNERS